LTLTSSLSVAEYLHVLAARRRFEAVRARYIRARAAERAADRLRPLQMEQVSIGRASARMQAALEFNLTRLASARGRLERVLPGSIRGPSIRRPSFFDRLQTFGESERLYREVRVWTFCRDEVASELARRRDRSALLASEMEQILVAEKLVVERRLQTPAGLRDALGSDAHFALAHGHLTQLTPS
jgi:hypothetical protein